MGITSPCVGGARGGTRPRADGRSKPGKLAHDAVERRLTLEADAGPVGQGECAVRDARIVGEAAEIAEYAVIRFQAAEAKAHNNGKRHLVAAVREQGRT